MKTVLASGLLCLSLILPSQAAVIVDNITGGPYSIGTSLGNGMNNAAAAKSIAFGITTGAAAMNFVSLEAIFDNFSIFQNRLVSGGIYGNNAGTPGSLLSAFGSQNLAPSANDILLTFTAAQLLLPNTTYWFVLSGPVGVGLLPNWQASGSLAPASSSNATSLGFLASSNSQASWSAAGVNNLQLRINADTGFQEFPLEGEIPEPSTMILSATGLLLAARFARRR